MIFLTHKASTKVFSHIVRITPMVKLLLLLLCSISLCFGDEQCLDGKKSKLELTLLTSILNSPKAKNPDYLKAIAAWPDEEEIWPHLKGVKAQKRFAAYILEQDDTNERHYKTFPNLCTGFASQFYLRYSSRADLPDQDITNIQKMAGVDLKKVVPKKLKAPIVMATYPGHFFNAFYINDKDPTSIDSYLIIEPQNDQFIDRQHPSYKKYAEKSGISFTDLTSFNSKGQFSTPAFQSLLIDGKGIHRAIPKATKLYVPFLFIAETGAQNYEFQIKGKSFDAYLTQRFSYVSDKDILALAEIMDGKQIKESPDGPLITLSKKRFFQMVGRPQLGVSGKQ